MPEGDTGRMRGVCAALCAVPMALCIVLAFAFAYDAPYWDGWLYATPIAKAFEGGLRPSDFLVRVNEHICLTSSLIAIPLARLTHWDMRAEIAATLFFYFGTFALLIAALRGEERARGSLWAAPVMACLLFSASQYVVWNWGLLLCLSTAVFFLVAALGLLSHERAGGVRIAAAIFAAWAATFSIGGGLAVWPAGTVVLLLRRFDRAGTRWRAIAAWLASGGIASAVFLWAGSGGAPGIGKHLPDPVGALVYVLAFLGGPIAAFNGVAAAIAGAGLVVAYGMWLRRAIGQDEPNRAMPFVCGLGVTALTAAVLTSLKHAPEGVTNAISSRFLPWGTLAWCGLAIALYGSWPRMVDAPRWARGVLAVIVLAVIASSGYGAYRADEHHDAFLLGRRALIEDTASPDMKFLHPEPEKLGGLRQKLIDHRLTVFRDASEIKHP